MQPVPKLLWAILLSVLGEYVSRGIPDVSHIFHHGWSSNHRNWEQGTPYFSTSVRISQVTLVRARGFGPLNFLVSYAADHYTVRSILVLMSVLCYCADLGVWVLWESERGWHKCRRDSNWARRDLHDQPCSSNSGYQLQRWRKLHCHLLHWCLWLHGWSGELTIFFVCFYFE